MREKIVLLIPLTFNDGSKIPEQMFQSCLDDLYLLCGGYRVAGHGPGAYRMRDGSKKVEETVEVWAAIEQTDLPRLTELVKKWCAKLGQECIWFERTGATVEFLGQDTPGGSNG